MSIPYFEPPPTYAEPFILDSDGKSSHFNPIWIRWFIKLIAVINGSGGGGGTIQHSALGGIQGGTTGEYYHLTSARYSVLTGVTAANTVLAGPASGGSVISTFRSLVVADLPSVIISGGPTGGAATVPVITYNAEGLLTAVSTATVTPASIGAQTANANLTSIAGLANAAGWLHNDGAGAFVYSTPTAAQVGAPSGSGTSTGSNTGDNVEVAAQTIGFTITKGTTPKTLTVALDANVAGTNTGDQTNITGNAGTVTNGVYTTGAGTVFLAPTGSAANLTSFPTFNQDTTGKSAKTDALNSATTVVNVAASAAPTTGDVLTATDSTHATWQAAPTSSVPPGLTAFLAAHG